MKIFFIHLDNLITQSEMFQFNSFRQSIIHSNIFYHLIRAYFFSIHTYFNLIRAFYIEQDISLIYLDNFWFIQIISNLFKQF